MILFCTLPTTVYPKHLSPNLLHVPLTCLCKLILHPTSRTLCAVILSLSLQYFHSSTFYILKSFPSHSIPETIPSYSLPVTHGIFSTTLSPNCYFPLYCFILLALVCKTSFLKVQTQDTSVSFQNSFVSYPKLKTVNSSKKKSY